MTYSTTIVLIAIGLATALAAADWYVWGRTYASDIRTPRSPRPLKAMELIDGILRRSISANQAVLPRSAAEPEVVQAANAAVTEGQAASDDRDRNGFKKVA
jgi:hypothetical protein